MNGTPTVNISKHWQWFLALVATLLFCALLAYQVNGTERGRQAQLQITQQREWAAQQIQKAKDACDASKKALAKGVAPSETPAQASDACPSTSWGTTIAGHLLKALVVIL